MEIRRFSVVGVIIFYLSQVYSQSTNISNLYEGQYFRSPVDYTFQLSGNFCELRETHFHAGIDIKPSSIYGRVPLYSIGNGYVSRIKISAGGYGKAIFIEHPDVGYTSVYAHLDGFSDQLELLINQYQKSLESYEIDILLNPDILPIEKGAFIGNMGNTGHSFGKHLHFEIRDTKTEKPINPFHLGIRSEDHIAPSLITLSIHGLDPDFYKIWEKRVSLIHQREKEITIATPIEVPAWRAGIAINMLDKSDKSHNKLGIYGFHLYVDDSLVYSYHLDKIAYDQSRYITGFYDYKVKKKENTTYSLCYKYPGNNLDFLSNSGNGIIPVFIAKERKVRMEIEDFNRNRRTIHFSLIRAQQMTEQIAKDSTLSVIKVGDSLTIHENNLSIYFEPNSLFRNIRLDIQKEENAKYETKYHIHDKYEPIKKPIKIGLKPKFPITDKLDKAIIVRTNGNGGGKVNYGGRWSKEQLTTEMIEFGTFFIDYDTIAPSIKSISFTPNVGKKSEVRFHVKDNLPTRGKMVDNIRIKVWIDGNFVVSPYTSKTQILQIPMIDLSNGGHDLKIEVIDHSGNVANFTAGFVVKK